MEVNEEEQKKSTTKRKITSLRKKPQPKLSAEVVIALPTIVSLSAVPRPAVETVKPPKARPHWWVVVLCFLFASAAIAIVGYVTIARPFSSESTAPAKTSNSQATIDINTDDNVSSTPTSWPSIYDYGLVANPVALSDFYTLTTQECPLGDAPALEWTKPATSEKLRFDLVVMAEASYTDGASFDRDFHRLGALVDLADEHHLKATIYLGAAFAKTALTLGKDDVATWVKGGHQVALAFSALPTDTPYGSWLGAMHSDLEDLKELCDCVVSGWTGGDDYAQMYAVAKELGLTTNVGWKNPDGTTPSDLVLVNPWIPESSGSLAAMKTFDPFGSVVYLPDGLHSPVCPGTHSPFNENTFTYSTKALYATMSVTDADHVNVFRLVTSLDAFGDVADDQDELKAWGSWLTMVIDPLTKSGKLTASTDSATAEAFIAWLDQNIGDIELE